MKNPFSTAALKSRALQTLARVSSDLLPREASGVRASSAPLSTRRNLIGLVISLVVSLYSHPARSADVPHELSPGVVEFAGRVARNHWYLFGSEKRAELETLNRELRKTKELILYRQTSESPEALTNRAVIAASRVLKHVKNCPRLIRVDLTAAHSTLTPSGPFELPGDTGALLFAVAAGGEGVSYSSTMFDWSESAGEFSIAKFDAAATGTTYAVVGLERVPQGRSTMGLEIRRPDQRPVQLTLDLVTAQRGSLKLTVLSDDTGRPAPAMVRLMWHTDGVARQPVNGIDFGPQFANQGKNGRGGERNPVLPGKFNESFWCVPGSFEMSLAPGNWQVGIRRGVEHELIFEDVTIRSGEVTERVFRPKRWVNMKKRGWWSGDDHVHARLLSDVEARNLMTWAQAEDVHLANIVEMGDIYRTLFEQRGFGPEFRVLDGQRILSPSQECPRTPQLGHTLAMNTTSLVRNPERYFLYDEAFDAVHAQGGLTGYAHVQSGDFRVHRDMSLNVPRGKVDFAEILQFNQLGTSLYYDFLNIGCKLTASAGSDVPWGGTIGEVRTYAYLGKKSFSTDAWFESFRRGRTFTSSGPMIEFRVDDALPGDELQLKSDRKLRIRARAWGDPKRMSLVKLEIVRHGEVIRAAESKAPKQNEAELDLSVDAGYGCWIAARAFGGDGTSAHTTPVYVVREGFRFWKHDGLEELFAKRLASLTEIEKIISEARGLDAQGRLEGDRYRKELARQGDLLLKRVASARELYADLKRTAEAERGPRGLPER